MTGADIADDVAVGVRDAHRRGEMLPRPADVQVHVKMHPAERVPVSTTGVPVQARFTAAPAVTVTESPAPLLIEPSLTTMLAVPALKSIITPLPGPRRSPGRY